jgi:prepilin-type N-terminal cleavage/methylation domain-containing protein
VNDLRRPVRRRRPAARRGFNLVELLIALAISAVLLTATMVALDASYRAYQATTEVASTHTVSRLVIHRMQALIRTGQEFGPFPTAPTITTVASDFIEFRTPDGDVMEMRWVGTDPTLQDNSLYVIMNPGTASEQEHLLLEGVIPQYDPPTSTDDADRIRPFTLEYELGRNLFRATIDLTIVPDDNMSVALDGNNTDVIRLVASAMPRSAAYD